VSIRAQWHLEQFLDAKDDPFDTVVYSSGLVVDLTGTDEQLHSALAETVRLEGLLYNGGLRCDLKEEGQDCSTCPVSQMNPAERLSRLCRLGKDQCNIVGRLEERKQARVAPLVELGRSVEEYVELAEAML
jgi:hypothetical protein